MNIIYKLYFAFPFKELSSFSSSTVFSSASFDKTKNYFDLLIKVNYEFIRFCDLVFEILIYLFLFSQFQH